MAYYSGPNGELWIDGSRAGQVRNWSFTTSVQTLDTTALGQTDTTAEYGLRNTSGTCSLFYWQDTPGSGGSCSTLINSIVQGRTASDTRGVAQAPAITSLRLRVNDGTADGRYIRGECLITSASMNMAQGEIFSAQITFQMIGAPTEVTL